MLWKGLCEVPRMCVFIPDPLSHCPDVTLAAENIHRAGKKEFVERLLLEWFTKKRKFCHRPLPPNLCDFLLWNAKDDVCVFLKSERSNVVLLDKNSHQNIFFCVPLHVTTWGPNDQPYLLLHSSYTTLHWNDSVCFQTHTVLNTRCMSGGVWQIFLLHSIQWVNSIKLNSKSRNTNSKCV